MKPLRFKDICGPLLLNLIHCVMNVCNRAPWWAFKRQRGVNFSRLERWEPFSFLPLPFFWICQTGKPLIRKILSCQQNCTLQADILSKHCFTSASILSYTSMCNYEKHRFVTTLISWSYNISAFKHFIDPLVSWY